MPQVWGLLSNQINKLLHHWDCQNQKLSNTKVNNFEKKRKQQRKNKWREIQIQRRVMCGQVIIRRSYRNKTQHILSLSL